MKNTFETTKLFAVLGNPITHSLSPTIHNYAFKKLGLESFYTRFCLPQDIVANDLRSFVLSSDLSGVNITLPFKERSYQAVDSIEGIANQIGAINTIVRRDQKLIGYNTDAEGFYHAIKHYEPKHILLLGAGGSARSIALILSQHNMCLTIANRSVDKLTYFKQFGDTMSFDELCRHANTQKYDIIVNATSASINGLLPIPKDFLIPLFKNCKLAYDLMYQHDDTAFCALAKQYTNALDGKAMLIYQGAIALLYFHDIEFSDRKFMDIANFMAESLSIIL